VRNKFVMNKKNIYIYKTHRQSHPRLAENTTVFPRRGLHFETPNALIDPLVAPVKTPASSPKNEPKQHRGDLGRQ
jgi:hypothetical protein